ASAAARRSDFTTLPHTGRRIPEHSVGTRYAAIRRPQLTRHPTVTRAVAYATCTSKVASRALVGAEDPCRSLPCDVLQLTRLPYARQVSAEHCVRAANASIGGPQLTHRSSLVGSIADDACTAER